MANLIDSNYCEHGVYRDQPCGRCMGGVEQHRHKTLDEALGCAHCQAVYQAVRTPKKGARDATPPSVSSQAGELEGWWLKMAHEEIERTVPKALEYGSHDLDEIGRQIRLVGGLGVSDTSDLELGVYFYMVGKMARWTDAIRTGRRVSDDTLFDLGIYIRMVQRARHSGGWPGTHQAGGE